MSQDAQRQIGPPPSYHACYRTVLRAVDARYDVRGSVLAEMVKACLAQRATLPAALRAHFAQYAPAEAMAYLERVTATLLFGPKGRFSPQEYRYSGATALGKSWLACSDRTRVAWPGPRLQCNHVTRT
ncbi:MULTISPECIES: hypothetical protein [Pseudomonas aeruginosa group]|uniref:Uncharacterized protein n=3 Tax=Gammaproteobacteria TaxID=1236 RepID=A0ABD7JUH5_PSEAI|nr:MULTISPECIES: hypothetical protein [Pseudomonas aeruginosa group]KFF35014.1 hypothetical protein G039_0312845 [Pseudomonas aeruginosa VRFPA01]HDB4676103.1 hypothetical protein [Staphylococcus aureus]ALY63733.1 hypothetical protein HW05_02220 [Pseudomonas aeruginosa]EIE45662.1 hypothetical protein CF510_14859 [Pseudomonas aeruginosa PADK2_CF510]EKU7421726.1 hypothetical protein [Pseudomonas aeruginosa]